MPFNIQTFIQHISNHNSVAHGDKFDVHIAIPNSIAQTASMEQLSLQCEISELPSRDINMIEYRHYSFIKRLPHHNQYGQASFTFIVTGDMWEKKLFDRWMDIMVPAQTGLIAYPEDKNNQRVYETDITCNQYDTQGNLIYSAKLIDAMPTSTSALMQSWDNDAIHKLVVGFNFRKWTSNSTSSDTSTKNPPINNYVNIPSL